MDFCTLTFSSVIVVQQDNDEIVTRHGYVTYHGKRPGGGGGRLNLMIQ